MSALVIPLTFAAAACIAAGVAACGTSLGRLAWSEALCAVSCFLLNMAAALSWRCALLDAWSRRTQPILMDTCVKHEPVEHGIIAREASDLAATVIEGRTTVRPEVGAVSRLVAPNQISQSAAERFLAARRDDPAKAAKLYNDYLAWRKAENIDDVLSEPPLAPAAELELQERFNPYLLSGLDYHGRPVMYAAFGKLDITSLARMGIGVKDVARRYVRALEELQQRAEQSAGSSSSTSGHMIILDVYGCTIVTALKAWGLWLAMAKISQEYYPELLGHLCIVRAPRAGQWLVDKFRRTALDPLTAEKLEMHSGDPRPPLAKYLPTTVELPPELLDPPSRSSKQKAA